MTHACIDLPQGWVECQLGDVVNYGATLKAEPEEIPPDAWVLELEDIEKDTSKVLQRATHAQRQSKSTKNRFDSGDVLYGKLRPYLNKVVLADESGYCTTEIIPLSPPSGLDGRYLFYWLKHPRFLEYVTAASHGLNMPRLGTEAGRTAPFVLAPPAEQKRIADKLDVLLTRVDACRERVDRIPGILKRFRQAVLAAATSGELTMEISNSRAGVAEPWEVVPFELLLSDSAKLSYGVLKPGAEDKDGVPMFRVVDIGPWGKRNNTVPSMISTQLSREFGRTVIEPGDILLSVMATIGRAMVASDEMVGANVNRAIAVVKPDRAKVDSHYLMYHLLSPKVVQEFEAASIGSAQVRINLSHLRKFMVGLPALEEQREIVRRVQSLFRFADELEARHSAANRRLEALSSSIIAKAFRGELVPQDPNDESAEVLLARMVMGRSTPSQPIPRKQRHQRAPRAPKEASAMTKSRQDEDVKGKPYLAGHLRKLGVPSTAAALFKVAELHVADFYKQLAWEVEQGHVKDNRDTLESVHAPG